MFDPFMGLATTGVSCVRLGRRFVGSEIYEPYYWIAYDRMVREASQVSMFGFDDAEHAEEAKETLFNQ